MASKAQPVHSAQSPPAEAQATHAPQQNYYHQWPQHSPWWDESMSPQPQQQQPQRKREEDNDDMAFWNKVARIICAILLPPLGVFLQTGCDKNFLINVLLTILGYIPGIIHALYVILSA